MALVTKMNRCAVCGSSQISLMADGKYYHCEACGATSNHTMPAADLAQAVLLFDVLHTDHQFIFTHVRTPLHRIDEGLFDLAEKRQTHDQQHGGPGQRKHPH